MSNNALDSKLIWRMSVPCAGMGLTDIGGEAFDLGKEIAGKLVLCLRANFQISQPLHKSAPVPETTTKSTRFGSLSHNYRNFAGLLGTAFAFDLTVNWAALKLLVFLGNYQQIFF